jgi:Tol biopolymer transport system component
LTTRDGTKFQLWIRSLDSLAAQPLPGTEGAGLPFWSPDSRSIGFFAGGKLKRIDVDGGPAQVLSDAASGRGGSWNRDGVIVFAPNNIGPLNRVSSAGGETTSLTKLMPDQQNHRFPSFLPDGRHFLYFATGTTNDIFVGSLDSAEGQRLIAADSQAAYAAPGFVLFIRQGTLLVQSFDADRLQLNGEPIPIAERVGFNALGGAFSVSENGVLEYRTGTDASNVKLTWVDRNGKLLGSIGDPGNYQAPDISPDGYQIAVHRHDGRGGDVWLVESTGGKTTRLTFDASQDNSQPVWSPDGSRIVFASRRNGKWGRLKPSNNYRD